MTIFEQKQRWDQAQGEWVRDNILLIRFFYDHVYNNIGALIWWIFTNRVEALSEAKKVYSLTQYLRGDV